MTMSHVSRLHISLCLLFVLFCLPTFSFAEKTSSRALEQRVSVKQLINKKLKRAVATGSLDPASVPSVSVIVKGSDGVPKDLFIKRYFFVALNDPVTVEWSSNNTKSCAIQYTANSEKWVSSNVPNNGAVSTTGSFSLIALKHYANYANAIDFVISCTGNDNTSVVNVFGVAGKEVANPTVTNTTNVAPVVQMSLSVTDGSNMGSINEKGEISGNVYTAGEAASKIVGYSISSNSSARDTVVVENKANYTMSWKSVNAKSCTLAFAQNDGGNTVKLGTEGTLQWTPTASSLANSATATLICQNSLGQNVPAVNLRLMYNTVKLGATQSSDDFKATLNYTGGSSPLVYESAIVNVQVPINDLVTVSWEAKPDSVCRSMGDFPLSANSALATKGTASFRVNKQWANGWFGTRLSIQCISSTGVATTKALQLVAVGSNASNNASLAVTIKDSLQSKIITVKDINKTITTPDNSVSASWSSDSDVCFVAANGISQKMSSSGTISVDTGKILKIQCIKSDMLVIAIDVPIVKGTGNVSDVELKITTTVNGESKTAIANTNNSQSADEFYYPKPETTSTLNYSTKGVNSCSVQKTTVKNGSYASPIWVSVETGKTAGTILLPASESVDGRLIVSVNCQIGNGLGQRLLIGQSNFSTVVPSVQTTTNIVTDTNQPVVPDSTVQATGSLIVSYDGKSVQFDMLPDNKDHTAIDVGTVYIKKGSVATITLSTDNVNSCNVAHHYRTPANSVGFTKMKLGSPNFDLNSNVNNASFEYTNVTGSYLNRIGSSCYSKTANAETRFIGNLFSIESVDSYGQVPQLMKASAEAKLKAVSSANVNKTKKKAVKKTVVQQ